MLINLGLLLLNALMLWLLTRWLEYYSSVNFYGFAIFAGLNLVVAVALTVLLLDLFTYLLHRLFHQNSFLWRFHSVHHTDKILDVTSAFRFHSGEILITFLLRFGFVYFLGLPLWGLVIFEVIFGFFNQFEHSFINLSSSVDKPLTRLFITPQLHRRHHHIDSTRAAFNYGTIFSFWDRLFESFEGTSGLKDCDLGVYPQQKIFKFTELLVLPFRDFSRKNLYKKHFVNKAN